MHTREQVLEELQSGRIDTARLIDLIVALQRELQPAQQRVAELEKQIASRSAKVDDRPT
jgi:hypothetical protein